MAEGKTFGDAAHIVLLDIRGTAQTAAALGALAAQQVALCPDGCASPCPRRLLNRFETALRVLLTTFFVGMENSFVFFRKGREG